MFKENVEIDYCLYLYEMSSEPQSNAPEFRRMMLRKSIESQLLILLLIRRQLENRPSFAVAVDGIRVEGE